MRLNPKYFAFFLIFFLAAGALGLRTLDECSDLYKPSDKIRCYHEAAISYAYLKNSAMAEGACDKIMTTGQTESDFVSRAETERNACLFDIARVIAVYDADAVSLCAGIEQTTSADTELTGSAVTQSMCYETISRIVDKSQESYVGNPNNLCSLLFVLPALVFIILIKNQNP